MRIAFFLLYTDNQLFWLILKVELKSRTFQIQQNINYFTHKCPKNGKIYINLFYLRFWWNTLSLKMIMPLLIAGGQRTHLTSTRTPKNKNPKLPKMMMRRSTSPRMEQEQLENNIITSNMKNKLKLNQR